MLDTLYDTHNQSNKEVNNKMVMQENNPGFFDFKEEGDKVTGVLIKITTDVGPNKAMVYTLEVKTKPINVWGCTILDQRMVGIKVGEIVEIVYKGLGEAKGGHNQPKIFKVLVDRPEPQPLVEEVKVE